MNFLVRVVYACVYVICAQYTAMTIYRASFTKLVSLSHAFCAHASLVRSTNKRARAFKLRPEIRMRLICLVSLRLAIGQYGNAYSGYLGC